LKIRGDIRKSRCTTGVNDTGGKFAAGVNDTGGKLPPVSTTPAANLPPVSATNLNDIWAMFFLIPSRCEKLVLLMLLRTSGDGYSLLGSKK
jgi:hypothetical protein